MVHRDARAYGKEIICADVLDMMLHGYGLNMAGYRSGAVGSELH